MEVNGDQNQQHWLTSRKTKPQNMATTPDHAQISLLVEKVKTKIRSLCTQSSPRLCDASICESGMLSRPHSIDLAGAQALPIRYATALLSTQGFAGRRRSIDLSGGIGQRRHHQGPGRPGWRTGIEKRLRGLDRRRPRRVPADGRRPRRFHPCHSSQAAARGHSRGGLAGSSARFRAVSPHDHAYPSCDHRPQGAFDSAVRTRRR